METQSLSYHNWLKVPMILGLSIGAIGLLGFFSQALGQPSLATTSPVEGYFRGSTPAMGVVVRYELYGAEEAFSAAERIIEETLEELENIFSDYRRDSEVSRLCRTAPNAEPVKVSEHLWRLSERARELSKETHGAFDITVGPVSHLWRGAIKRRRLPEMEKISAACASVGYDKLHLFPGQRLQLTAPQMQLDFGGIAKGYAADVIIERLRRCSLRGVLIDVGGDVTVFGLPTARKFWTIQVGEASTDGVTILALKAVSVATSGDTVQRLAIDGVHYSHLVDPRTGQASTTSHLVTVIAPDGVTADALASAFSILSVAEIEDVSQAFPGVAVRVVYRVSAESAELLTFQTPGFSAYLSAE